MLIGLYSRNGTQLFKKDTTNPKDLTNLTYNKADIGTYLSKNLNNFFELIKQFKTVDQENVTFDIYTEVMLLKSPLNIPYSEDIKNKIYIFQINTTKDSYRINDKLSDKIVKLDIINNRLIPNGGIIKIIENWTPKENKLMPAIFHYEID